MTDRFSQGDALVPVEQEMTQERILRWAELSGDFNRLHVDPAFAATTPFGGPIAHGPMSLGFLMQLMMQNFGEAWARGGKLLDVRFLAPIRPGDRLSIGGRVTQVREEEGYRVVECELWVRKVEGQKAVVGRGICPLPRGGT